MNKLLLLLIVLVMPACTVYTMPGPSYAAGSSFSYGYSVEAYPTPARYSYGYSPEYVPSTTPIDEAVQFGGVGFPARLLAELLPQGGTVIHHRG